MRDFITPIGGFLVIGCLIAALERMRYWRSRADYWFTRAMDAEADLLRAHMERV